MLDLCVLTSISGVFMNVFIWDLIHPAHLSDNAKVEGDTKTITIAKTFAVQSVTKVKEL